LVARAHLQHLPHLVSQLCLTLRARLHVRIPPLTLGVSQPSLKVLDGWWYIKIGFRGWWFEQEQ
jgi:hypothetical protein